MTQKEKIVELEAQLAAAQRNTYVTDTHSLWAADNELYIQYGDNNRLIVFDIDALYPDLVAIVNLARRERQRQERELKKKLAEL
tara:strand:- start:4881 stop:5132 length:252 start_codon:yes stop_codon:yes gene_type:complete